MVTSEQSPHLLLPLTSFGPQGHKIRAEIELRISSDECAIYRAASAVTESLYETDVLLCLVSTSRLATLTQKTTLHYSW